MFGSVNLTNFIETDRIDTKSRNYAKTLTKYYYLLCRNYAKTLKQFWQFQQFWYFSILTFRHLCKEFRLSALGQMSFGRQPYPELCLNYS